MRSLLQNSFTKKAAGLMLGAALSLFSADAFAATFTAKSGTSLQWNGGSATWIITNGTALNSSYPSYNDDVIINDGNQVNLNISGVECKSLSIVAPNGNSGTTNTSYLYIGANTLEVFGTIVISGGALQGQTARTAELEITSGMVILQSTITPSTFPLAGATDYNRIIVPAATASNQILINQTGMSPLPVELVSFTANKKSGEVALSWETASEKNNSGFEVQASIDGKNYEAVAFVASRNGNSSSAQRYAYSHKTANQEGLVYFRLKQVDLNGTFEYYTAKVVDLGRINATANTFPNPFQNRFELNLTAAATETADILVMDMTGKTVYVAKQQLSKGVNTISVELNNQPAGLYLLKATAGNQTYTNRLVKQ